LKEDIGVAAVLLPVWSHGTVRSYRFGQGWVIRAHRSSPNSKIIQAKP